MKKIKIINIVLDVLIVLMVFILLFSIIFRKNNDTVESNLDFTKYDLKELDDESFVEDLKFSDSTIIHLDNYRTTISVNISNIGKSDYYISGVSAIVYDENHNKIVTLFGDSRMIVASSETVVYTFETDEHLYDSAAYIEYIPLYKISSDEGVIE